MEGRYDRAKELFLAVCNLDDEERRARLDRDCADDPALRSEVESLLAHHEEPPTIAPPPGGTLAMPGGPRRDPGRIGPYRIVREIGRGGMGVVYLGMRDGDRFKRRVAVKVLRRGMDTEEILQRFEQERQVLGALNHPGIARLFDAGETDEGLPYFAMEHVEGQPIDEYCDTHRLEIPERLELFRQVCDAIQYVHRNLMVHRDLKPTNILVTGEGQAKLLDFGIAKLINPEISMLGGDPTAPELRVMTPEYASPEQVRGMPITAASDIYSLGVILYELVTGHRPYRIKSRVRAEIERVICDVEPERPSTAASRVEVIEADEHESGVSTTITPEIVAKLRGGRPERIRRRLVGDIDNVVLMAMRKEPQRRYESAQQFGEDIRRHLAGLPVIARRDTAGYRFVKFVRRNRWGVAAAAVVTLALVGWGITAASGWAAERHHSQALAEERDRTRRMLDETLELAHVFIFDFYDEIRPLDGTLTARKMLAESAQACLEDLRPDVGDDPKLLRELADAYDKVGDLWRPQRGASFGDTSIALANYETAMGMRLTLLEKNPDDRELRYRLAEGYWRIGDVKRFTGDVEAALAAYQKDLEICEALAETDPKYRRSVAVALADVGAALKDQGRLAEARRHYERSLAVRRQLLSEDSGDTRALRAVGVGLMHVAEARELLGDVEGALEVYQEVIPLREELVRRDPERSQDRRFLAWPHHFAARALIALDRPDEAAPHVEAAVAIFEQRARDNEESARAQFDLGAGLEMRGRLLAAQGDPAAALEAYHRYESIMRELRDRDTDNTQYAEMLAESLDLIGEAYGQAGELSAAIWSCRQALEIAKPLAESDTADVDLELLLARTLSTLGGLLNAASEHPEAESRLADARSIQEGVLAAHDTHARARDGLVLTLRRLSQLAVERGDADDALAFAKEALRTAGRRDAPALRDLAAAQALAGERAQAAATAREALVLLADSHGPAARALRAQLEEDLLAYGG